MQPGMMFVLYYILYVRRLGVLAHARRSISPRPPPEPYTPPTRVPETSWHRYLNVDRD